MKIDCINFTCQGESHKATNKVCQDYSYSKIYENGLAVAIVCDGHGGKRYFRSDIGARLACEVTEKNVNVFLETIDKSLFTNKPYTSHTDIATQIHNSQFEKENDIDKAFRQLFSSIIFDWNTKILKHAKSTPLNEEELQYLGNDWKLDFEQGISLEKVYGCTLMTYVQTSTFWFAFHIGDGKCVSFDSDAKWSEPIPWDDRCFLNKTTSLCDSTAIEEFRYCYEGNGNFPSAIFLGSDGMDDSFGEELNLVNFYVQIVKELAEKDKEDVLNEIKTTLPQLSKIGSKDDMSLAVVFNQEELSKLLPRFISWQVESTKNKINNINIKILEKKSKISLLENTENITKRTQIEYNYAFSDLKKLFTEKTGLVKRINILLNELYGEGFTPYMDSVGLQLEEQENQDLRG